MTTGTYRYQDRWKWILPASRSSLNPPGPPEKNKNLSFRTRHFTKQIGEKLLYSLLIPFWGPVREGFLFTVYRICGRQIVTRTSNAKALVPVTRPGAVLRVGVGPTAVLLASQRVAPVRPSIHTPPVNKVPPSKKTNNDCQ